MIEKSSREANAGEFGAARKMKRNEKQRKRGSGEAIKVHQRIESWWFGEDMNWASRYDVCIECLHERIGGERRGERRTGGEKAKSSEISSGFHFHPGMFTFVYFFVSKRCSFNPTSVFPFQFKIYLNHNIEFLAKTANFLLLNWYDYFFYSLLSSFFFFPF